MRRAFLLCAAIAFAIACGDGLTEPVLDRQSPRIQLATTTTEDGLSITTDKDDYAPGDTVHFTGAGWQPGDMLDVVLVDDAATQETHTWTVSVGEDGTFHDSTYVVDTDDLGVTFTLTATSRATGRSLTVTFTDGNVRANAAPDGVTYIVTATRFSTTNCTGTGTVLTAPGGATVTSSTPVSFPSQNGQSVLLVANATSQLGDAFSDWTTTDPGVVTESGTSLCVLGFGNNENAGGTRNYTAVYDAKVDLTINKDDAGATFGNTGQYTLIVTNIGTATTTAPIQVNDPLPAGLTFQSFTGTGWNCPAAAGATNVVCTRSAGVGLRLSPSESAPAITITVNVVAPPSGGSFINTASVSGGGEPAGNTGNNSDTETTPVVDLTIDKSHVGNFTRGTNEEYTISVGNAGSAPTNADVTVTDVLPSGLTFVSGTGVDWSNCTAMGQNVTCIRPAAKAIAAGGTAPAITLVVDVGASTAASITNTASVSGGGEPNPNNGNNSDTDPTTVVDANAPPVAVNDAYSVYEDNTLTVVARGVLGNDTDPDGNALTAVLVSGPAAASTSSFTLNPDGSFNFTPATNFNGPVSFTYRANDGLVNSVAAATVTITVNPVNDPPTFTKGPNQTVLEDAGAQTVTGWATNISAGPSDESSQTVSFQVSNDNPGLFSAQPAVSSGGTLTFTSAPDANGTANVTVVAQDDGGTANGGDNTSESQSFIITVTAVNDEPSFNAGANQSADEGAGVQTVTGWATNISAGPPDESGQTLTFEIVGNTNPGIFSTAPAVASNGTLTYTPSLGPNGTSTISVRLKDNGGIANGGDDTSDPQTFTITVNNVNPTVTIQSPADYSVWSITGFLGISNFISASFTDPGSADTHVCTINWGNGTQTSGVITEISGSNPGTCKLTPASNPYLSTGAGIYTLTVTVTDNDLGEGSASRTLIVYDPAAGFVTGGGWFNSPAGAYIPNPSAAGKANFGFVSKYTKNSPNTPIGNTEFQFQAGNLNFHSESYEWLLVNKSGTNAQYKGVGTINGAGSYKFMLWAADGGGYDTFRMKIWYDQGGSEVVVYDNLGGTGGFSTVPIGGGSIVIHTNGGLASK